jgi:hypothetical protein
MRGEIIEAANWIKAKFEKPRRDLQALIAALNQASRTISFGALQRHAETDSTL